MRPRCTRIARTYSSTSGEAFWLTAGRTRMPPSKTANETLWRNIPLLYLDRHHLRNPIARQPVQWRIRLPRVARPYLDTIGIFRGIRELGDAGDGDIAAKRR